MCKQPEKGSVWRLQGGRGHHLPQERNHTISGRCTYVPMYIGASYIPISTCDEVCSNKLQIFQFGVLYTHVYIVEGSLCGWVASLGVLLRKSPTKGFSLKYQTCLLATAFTTDEGSSKLPKHLVFQRKSLVSDFSKRTLRQSHVYIGFN